MNLRNYHFRIDSEQIESYRIVCGYECILNDGIPSCFLEHYFNLPIILAVSRNEFPLSPLG